MRPGIPELFEINSDSSLKRIRLPEIRFENKKRFLIIDDMLKTIYIWSGKKAPKPDISRETISNIIGWLSPLGYYAISHSQREYEVIHVVQDREPEALKLLMNDIQDSQNYNRG